MPSDRDIEALVRLLSRKRMHTNEAGGQHRATAEDILAEGWRPPPRVITDPAELDELPVGSMVVDHFEAGCTRIGTDPVFGWVRATSALKIGRQYGGPHLPATVVHVPTEEARNGE